jgi:hypothetical protein
MSASVIAPPVSGGTSYIAVPGASVGSSTMELVGLALGVAVTDGRGEGVNVDVPPGVEVIAGNDGEPVGISVHSVASAR